MAKISKSLQELEKHANALLKSNKNRLKKAEDVEPGEISRRKVVLEDEEIPEDEDIDVEKSEDEDVDVEKCGDGMNIKKRMRKSEDADKDVEKSEDEDDDMSKADDLEMSEDEDDDMSKAEDDDEYTELEDDEYEDEEESLIEDEFEDEEELEEIEEEREELEASIKKSFLKNPDIRKSMKSSEANRAMVNILAKSMASVMSGMRVSNRKHSKSDDIMAKSMVALINQSHKSNATIAKLQRENIALKKSLIRETRAMKKSINSMMAQPKRQKSVSDINVNDRDFNKSLNGNSAKNKLSKADQMAILNNEFANHNPIVKGEDIIGLECNAPMRPEIARLISDKSK